MYTVKIITIFFCKLIVDINEKKKKTYFIFKKKKTDLFIFFKCLLNPKQSAVVLEFVENCKRVFNSVNLSSSFDKKMYITNICWTL